MAERLHSHPNTFQRTRVGGTMAARSSRTTVTEFKTALACFSCIGTPEFMHSLAKRLPLFQDSTSFLFTSVEEFASNWDRRGFSFLLHRHACDNYTWHSALGRAQAGRDPTQLPGPASLGCGRHHPRRESGRPPLLRPARTAMDSGCHRHNSGEALPLQHGSLP